MMDVTITLTVVMATWVLRVRTRQTVYTKYVQIFAVKRCVMTFQSMTDGMYDDGGPMRSILTTRQSDNWLLTQARYSDPP